MLMTLFTSVKVSMLVVINLLKKFTDNMILNFYNAYFSSLYMKSLDFTDSIAYNNIYKIK